MTTDNLNLQPGAAKTRNRMVFKLGLVVVGMFAFGYALVPLYEVFCDITGIGGKTGRVDPTVAAVASVDESRLITIEFTATSTVGLPWDFAPLTKTMKLHPGEVGDALYYALNRSQRRIVGQAVPSVAPQRAAKYFKKSECFCFRNQPLDGGERKEMPLRFIVDRDLPKDVRTITLSYSFFNADKFAEEDDATVSDAATNEPQTIVSHTQGLADKTLSQTMRIGEAPALN